MMRETDGEENKAQVCSEALESLGSFDPRDAEEGLYAGPGHFFR